MTRDLRDPQALGERLLGGAQKVRRSQSHERAPLSKVYDLYVGHLKIADYDDGGLMSNDPAKHHSQVKQTQLRGRREEGMDYDG